MISLTNHFVEFDRIFFDVFSQNYMELVAEGSYVVRFNALCKVLWYRFIYHKVPWLCDGQVSNRNS
jgi:hypothetical protein